MKQKIGYIIVSLLFIGSCTKSSLIDTVVKINLSNPVTGERYANLKYELIRIELDGNNEELGRETVHSGVTNAQGFGQFAYKSKSYSAASQKAYVEFVYFDDSQVDVPLGEYYSTVPEFVKPNVNLENDYHFDFIAKGVRIYWFKNTDCFDGNDKMIYKVKKSHTGNDNWSAWIGDGLITGCFEYFGENILEASETNIFQIKVTRNGIDSIYYDTFINHPYVTDTFKIFY